MEKVRSIDEGESFYDKMMKLGFTRITLPNNSNIEYYTKGKEQIKYYRDKNKAYVMDAFGVKKDEFILD